MEFSSLFGLRPRARYMSTSVVALGALAFTAQANAADIYAPPSGGYKDVPVIAPAPVWTGFYAGVNLGAAWSNLELYRNSFNDSSPAPVACAVGVAYCFGGDRLNATTAFGGGQLGYNWQGWGNFVFGLEADLEGIGGGNERTFIGAPNYGRLAGQTIAATLKEDGGFAGDVTGRLGYAWGSWLLYAKGGFAWFNPQLSASAVAYNKGVPVAGFNGWDNNSTLTGWTVGGGVEWLLNSNWSVKLEYQYYDFALNDNNWTATYNGSNYNSWKLFDHDLTVNTVKLGVNYHLTSSYVPLK